MSAFIKVLGQHSIVHLASESAPCAGRASRHLHLPAACYHSVYEEGRHDHACTGEHMSGRKRPEQMASYLRAIRLMSV
jgi:hypothetical protein